MQDPAKILNRRTFNPGEIIFYEGELGNQAFVVQKGRVRIVKDLPGGERGTLGFIEEGGIFGEMALIDRSPRMASAVAADYCVLVAIPEQVVRRKLEETDPFLRILLNMMLRLVRRTADTTPIPAEDMEALAERAEWAAIDPPELKR